MSFINRFTVILSISILLSGFASAEESRKLLDYYDLGEHILTGKTKGEIFQESKEGYFAARITGVEGSHAMLMYSVELLTFDHCKTKNSLPQFSDLRHGRDDLSGKNSWTEIVFNCKGTLAEHWSRHVKQLCRPREQDESAVLCEIMEKKHGKEVTRCTGFCQVVPNNDHVLYKY